jgi:DNA polymerase sigma
LKENIPTDITFDGYGVATVTSEDMILRHVGLVTCDLFRNFLAQMPGSLVLLPLLRPADIAPLALILKQIMYEKGLSNVYLGGISSYCLVLMIVSYIQLHGISQTHRQDGVKKNLGTLLLGFLDYYGKKFDYNAYGISLAPPG